MEECKIINISNSFILRAIQKFRGPFSTSTFVSMATSDFQLLFQQKKHFCVAIAEYFRTMLKKRFLVLTSVFIVRGRGTRGLGWEKILSQSSSVSSYRKLHAFILRYSAFSVTDCYIILKHEKDFQRIYENYQVLQNIWRELGCGKTDADLR